MEAVVLGTRASGLPASQHQLCQPPAGDQLPRERAPALPSGSAPQAHGWAASICQSLSRGFLGHTPLPQVSIYAAWPTGLHPGH